LAARLRSELAGRGLLINRDGVTQAGLRPAAALRRRRLFI
jgi:hypothetical protein